MNSKILGFLAVGLLAGPMAAQAVPTLVFDGATLVGVDNVDVGGTLYNAEFADGSCVSVFDGCNDVSDLTFDATTVDAATQALVDALNASSFVSPELVAGCGDPTFCGLLTPYGYISASVLVSIAGISTTGVTNLGVNFSGLITDDYSSDGRSTWVKWSVASNDNDGVPDADDQCENTVIPESAPTSGTLGQGRYALTQAGSFIFAKGPKTKGTYDTTDTAGCSCTQIVAALGLGSGQTKYGCSKSVMEAWILGLQ